MESKEYKSAHYHKNRVKYLESAKERYKANRAVILARRKELRGNQSPESRQKRLVYHKRYNVVKRDVRVIQQATVQYRYEYSYKRNAPKRGLAFELTFEQFKVMFEGNCHYCGDHSCRGIDRVDNAIGYTVSNSVGCCATCNKMKWILPKDTFIAQVKKIANFNTIWNH